MYAHRHCRRDRQEAAQIFRQLDAVQGGTAEIKQTSVRAQGFREYAVGLGDLFAKDAFLIASGRWTLGCPDVGDRPLHWVNWVNLLAHGPTGWLIALQMGTDPATDL